MNPTTEQKQEAYPQPQPQQLNQPPPAYNAQYGSPYPPNPQMPQPQYQYQQAPQTVHIISGVQQPGQPCLHYNQLTSYDACALACIIILCVEFFPLGLCSLFCLGAITRSKCFNCGHEVHSNMTGVYVTFGILQLVFAGYIGLYVYVVHNAQETVYDNYG